MSQKVEPSIVEVSTASRPKSRPRTRSSARAAGARFERAVADWLRLNVSEWVDRRVRTAARDCGDIANLRTLDGRRVVVAKRHGVADPAQQWVIMTLANFAALITEGHPE